jgi:CRISPR-associated protein Csd1
MILQTLTDYYDRLAADPQSSGLAPLGFSAQKISFCVVLDPTGKLCQFQPVGTGDNGKQSFELLIVPGQAKPSGSGINPCFLWDNAAYMLGFKLDDPKPERTRKSFEAFRERHLKWESEIDDAEFAAVCNFLKHWQPARSADHEELAEMVGSFGVFRIQGSRQYVHERPAVLDYWQRASASESDQSMSQCLVTGDVRPIAQLHEPKIKGVNDAQSGGAALVSFNAEAYTSYGKEQSLNSPVSVDAAFKYATALNYLLARRDRKVVLGDATTVFWTEKPTPFEDCFGEIAGQAAAEDDSVRQRTSAFLLRLRQGKETDDDLADAEVPFYVLGLSPNAARLSVRFWLVSSVGELLRRLQQHLRDLEIIGGSERAPTIRDLLDETAPLKNGWPDREKIPPLLAGALVRALLTGSAYPEGLYLAVLRRIRAEGFVDTQKRNDWRTAAARRAAILKACSNRKFRFTRSHQEVSVSLDPQRSDPGYRLGRWFAVLEKVQEEAYEDKLNATIRDRFFSSAMATPAAVFPRLIRLHQHHLRRIEHPGRRTNLEKLIQEIAGSLATFPPHLRLEDQGLFAIGYYHQRQDLFTKKEDSTASEEQA